MNNNVTDSNALSVETSEGEIVVELYTNTYKRTCEELLFAVSQGSWKNATLSSRGTCLLAEDPKGGCCIVDSIDDSLSHSGAGLLSLPLGVAGALLLTMAPQPNMDAHSLVVGRVAKGMSTLRRCAQAGGTEIKAIKPLVLPPSYRPQES